MDISVFISADTKALKDVERSIASVGNAGGKTGENVSMAMREAEKSTSALSGALSYAGGAIAAIGIGSLAADAMATYRSFESMTASLKTMTGSAAAADAAFAQIEEFAKTTPYNLDQSVEGFTKLKALGLDPSMEALRSYGNTASAMGKDLMQMVEAVADASTGEFERLKEFGIKASQEKDKVTFTFQGVETTVKKNSEEIQKYLLAIGNNQFGTAMADQMDTVNGAVSNAQDTFAKLQRVFIEQTGAADLFKASLGGISSIMESAIGWIDTATIEIAFFKDSLQFGDELPFVALRGIGDAIAWIGEAISPVLPYLGEFAAWAAGSGAAIGVATLAAGALSAAFTAVLSPVALVVAAVAGVGMAASYIYDNWDGIAVWWSGLWAGVQSTASSFISWWDSTTLAEKTVDIATGALDLAEDAAIAFIGWWNSTVLAEWIAPIDAEAAIDKAESVVFGFIDWWDNTTLVEKTVDIATAPLDLARSASESFFNWWDGSTLKQHSPEFVTDGIETARQYIESFFNWWDSTTLTEKVSDVTFETLKFAWDTAQQFGDWWNSWSLVSKDTPADATLIEKAWDIAQRFAAWWDGLSLKSLIPDIQMPDLGGVVDSMASVGEDAAQGLADGWSRLKSYVAGKGSETAGALEDAVRTRLDTHSPSRVMAAVGMDVSTGFAEGIESASVKVKIAAERAAKQAEQGFLRIVEGLEQQYLKLTEGDEAARRYELSMQGIVGANQNAVIAAEAQIKALEEQKTQQEEAAQAAKQAADEQVRAAQQVQAAIDGLSNNIEKQILQLTQGDEAARRYELGLQKITGSAADAIIVGEKHVKALQDQKAAADAAAQAAAQLAAAVSGIQQGIEKQIIALTQGDEAARRYELGLQGINGATAESIIAGEQHVKALQDQKKAAEEAAAAYAKIESELAGQADKQRLLEIELSQGADAAKRAELAMQGYTDAQIDTKLATEQNIEKLEEMKSVGASIGQTLTDGLLSGDWKSAGQSLLGIFKKSVLEPLMNRITGSIGNVMSGLMSKISGGLGDMLGSVLGGGSSGGGILGSIGGMLGIGGGAGGGIGGMLGGLFGGGGAGIMSMLGPIGMLGGALSLLSGIFGKKKGTVNFSQGMNEGEQLTGQGGHNGQEHYRNTAFGMVGLNADSNKVGRVEGFVPELHKALDAMVVLDQMIADVLPDSVDEITQALLEAEKVTGADTSEMLKQRYQAVFKALPEELQKAMQGGKNIMGKSAEEIVARYQEMAAAAQVTVPTLQNLGLNLGSTNESAIAATLGLHDLMGGMQAVLQSAQTYYSEFYSQEEQQQMAMAQSAAAVAQLNEQLGLTGQRALDTHEEVRAYVESLDLTKKKDQEKYAAIMNVIGALDSVADSGQSLDQIMASLPEQMLANAQAQLEQAQATKEAAETASDGMSQAERGLSSMSDAAGQAADSFNSAASAMGDASKAAASAARQASAAANQAITAANNAASARNTTDVDGRHATGLQAVPFDGYRAELHAGEMVVPAQTARALREIAGLPRFANGGITSGPSIAGEAGAEAVIPLRNGNALPVDLKLDLSAFNKVEAVARDSYEFSDLQRQLQFMHTASGYFGTTTPESSGMSAEAISAERDAVEARKKEIRNLLNTALPQSTIDSYNSTLDGMRNEFMQMNKSAAAATESVQKINWSDPKFSGWSKAMQDSYQSAHDMLEAAKTQAEAQQQLAQQQQQIRADYYNQMKLAEDLRYELAHGSEALQRRKLAEAGLNEQQINNKIAIDAEVESLQNAVKAMEQMTKYAIDLRVAANDLYFDQNLGLASPVEQLADARAEVERLAAAAPVDPEAAQALSAAVNEMLTLSREQNASSQAYLDDFYYATGLMDSVADQIDSRYSTGTASTVAQSATLPMPAVQQAPNVIDARPVFQQQQQVTDLRRENSELKQELAELRKIMTEIRDDQRQIGGDAYSQREQQTTEQRGTKAEVKQLREQQRTAARFQGVA